MTDNGHHLPCYDRRPWSGTIPSVGWDDRESAEMKSSIVVVAVLRKDDSSVPYDAPCHSLVRRLDSFPTTELDHGSVIPKGVVRSHTVSVVWKTTFGAFMFGRQQLRCKPVCIDWPSLLLSLSLLERTNPQTDASTGPLSSVSSSLSSSLCSNVQTPKTDLSLSCLVKHCILFSDRHTPQPNVVTYRRIHLCENKIVRVWERTIGCHKRHSQTQRRLRKHQP